MRTIGIINQKGGCGKTTVSINLAATLAAKGHKTLLVDMDPQSHCALGLAVPESRIEKSMADLLRAGLDGSIELSDIVWQVSRDFDLAPSSISLAGLEAQLSGMPDRDRRLAQVLSTAQDRYDFCIVDCPPSIGLLTFNALRAADEVLIPVETGYFALQGSIKQEQTIDMVARRVGCRVRFKVLATMYDVRTKLAREILSELRRHFGDQLLPVVINFNSKLKEAASFGQPITEYDAASRGMQDFEQLVQWLVVNPPQPINWEETQTQGAEALMASSVRPSANEPRVSRAAELVERARALSARTAALAAKLSTDPDAIMEGVAGQPDAEDLDGHGHASYNTPTPGPVRTRLVELYGARPTRQGLLFVQPTNGAAQLAVVGDFNEWDASRNPMVRDDSLGVWQALVPAPPGRYHYRLVADGKDMPDPYNARTEPDPAGALANVVEMGESLVSHAQRG